MLLLVKAQALQIESMISSTHLLPTCSLLAPLAGQWNPSMIKKWATKLLTISNLKCMGHLSTFHTGKLFAGATFVATSYVDLQPGLFSFKSMNLSPSWCHNWSALGAILLKCTWCHSKGLVMKGYVCMAELGHEPWALLLYAPALH